MHPRKFSEDEMTTIQGPQHQTTIQAPPHWYPLPLQLRYKATSHHGPAYGFGQARKISSKDIVFTPVDGLQPGMNVEIAVAWPCLLDGRVRLQLVLEATITSSQDGVAEARILAYDFRTRPQRAENGTTRYGRTPAGDPLRGSCLATPALSGDFVGE
jgi:hypothetical protein